MAEISRGAAGEVLAARFLRENGYDIVAVNFRTRFGEIDIVAQDKRYIVFAEVKTRGENPLYTGREAVTADKQKRLLKTAALYMRQHPTTLQPRFDVLEVQPDKNGKLEAKSVQHLQNAFEAGDLRAAF